MAEATEENELELLFPRVLQEYCRLSGSDGERLIENTSLEVVADTDQNFSPYPILRQNEGRDITMVCNSVSFNDGWESVFGLVNGVSDQLSKRIYLGVGIAWVGLVHAALDAAEYRPDQPRAILNRFYSIMEQLHDKRAISTKLDDLRDTEKIEVSLYPVMPEHNHVEEINRIRYGLGMSYLINNIQNGVSEDLSRVFADNFSSYLQGLGGSLIEFAEKFGLGKPVDPEIYKQQGLVKAFHSFYFAGIFPMDLSDIMDM